MNTGEPNIAYKVTHGTRKIGNTGKFCIQMPEGDSFTNISYCMQIFQNIYATIPKFKKKNSIEITVSGISHKGCSVVGFVF